MDWFDGGSKVAADHRSYDLHPHVHGQRWLDLGQRRLGIYAAQLDRKLINYLKSAMSRYNTALIVTALMMVLGGSPVAAQTQTQTQDELHATIMAAVLSDPRTANLPPAQLQALVNALAAKAKTQGVTSQDIAWRPQVPTTIAPAQAQSTASTSTNSVCDPAFLSLCDMSAAFGFLGNDYSIPVVLFITAGLLYIIVRRLHLHHHEEAQVQTQMEPPKPPPPAPYI